MDMDMVFENSESDVIRTWGSPQAVPNLGMQHTGSRHQGTRERQSSSNNRWNILFQTRAIRQGVAFMAQPHARRLMQYQPDQPGPVHRVWRGVATDPVVVVVLGRAFVVVAGIIRRTFAMFGMTLAIGMGPGRHLTWIVGKNSPLQPGQQEAKDEPFDEKISHRRTGVR